MKQFKKAEFVTLR